MNGLSSTQNPHFSTQRKSAPVSVDNTMPFAFFFLVLFTLFTLIRPQELPYLHELAALRPIAILTVLTTLMLFLVRPFHWQLQHTLLLLLIPFVAISGALNGWVGGGVFQAINYLNSSLLPMLMFSMLLTSGKRQKIVMWLFILASLLMIHNGHVQQHSWNGFGWAGIDTVENGRIRYLGILQDPNDLGMLFMICLPFALYFYSESNPLGKLLHLAIIAALIYGIYMTNSRGTMLGLLGISGLFLLLRYGNIKAIIAGMVAAPIFLFVVSTFREVSAEEASARGRLWAWWDGLEMLRANPVFGVGSGNFLNHHGRVAHNTYIQVVAELGFVGYLMWITMLFLTLMMGYQCVRKLRLTPAAEMSARLKSELKLAATCFYSLAAFCMTAFFLSRERFIILYMLLGIAIAAYVRVVQANNNQPLFEVRAVIPKILAGAIAVIIFTYIILKFTV